jgi:flagellar hook assembly protein FlgD
MDIVIAHPRRGEVLVQVLDVRGREVAARRFDTLDAGPQRIQWEPRDAEGRRLASGSYYVRVTAGAGAKSIRWMIVK